MAYLASRGWLARIRRGAYVTVPLGASAPSQRREDPWTVADDAFAPCYIAGWSACEHWGLTEQLYRDVVVVTGRTIRSRQQRIQDTVFILRHLRAEMHFGTRAVWRDQVRIRVSDPSRTLVDILDDPRLGGGIRQCADVLATYFSGEHRSDQQLLSYILRRGNHTVYKRLGYLLESLDIDAPAVVEACLAGQSQGLSLLDPTLAPRGTITKRWNLRVNAHFSASQEPS